MLLFARQILCFLIQNINEEKNYVPMCFKIVAVLLHNQNEVKHERIISIFQAGFRLSFSNTKASKNY